MPTKHNNLKKKKLFFFGKSKNVRKKVTKKLI